MKAGEEKITVTWAFNYTFLIGTDLTYMTIQVKPYAPISQKDRSWRKMKDELKKERTCQHKTVTRPYNASNNSFTWTVERQIPFAKDIGLIKQKWKKKGEITLVYYYWDDDLKEDNC